MCWKFTSTSFEKENIAHDLTKHTQIHWRTHTHTHTHTHPCKFLKFYLQAEITCYLLWFPNHQALIDWFPFLFPKTLLAGTLSITTRRNEPAAVCQNNKQTQAFGPSWFSTNQCRRIRWCHQNVARSPQTNLKTNHKHMLNISGKHYHHCLIISSTIVSYQ